MSVYNADLYGRSSKDYYAVLLHYQLAFFVAIVKVFRGLPNTTRCAPCALTIGNFDGVHRGHQALLAHLRKRATQLGLPAAVMTFEPHPREFFNPQAAPPRITLLRDKLEVLAASGVERVIVARFNAKFARQTPDDFVQHLLVNSLQARLLVVGDDFHYGAKRAGDFASLQAAGVRYGFTAEQMPMLAAVDGMRISSSAVRAALSNGDLASAHMLLGYHYAISGHVIHGKQWGRRLGFPTLNLRITPKHLALTGICVVQVYGLDGPDAQPLPGVASLGWRPTIDTAGQLLLEVHMLNWQGNAYGKRVRVEFLKKLRDEEKYADLTLLREAIAQDVEQARRFFNMR